VIKVDILDNFLKQARAAYEEAKINYNTGMCSAEALEGVRVALENLEQKAAAITSRRGDIK
jgi:hypothetical protein